jgi:hypothetical protein
MGIAVPVGEPRPAVSPSYAKTSVAALLFRSARTSTHFRRRFVDLTQ